MTPTPAHEDRLDSFLAHLGALLKVLLPIGEAVAAPFLKSAGAKAIEATDIPVVESVAEGLASLGK